MEHNERGKASRWRQGQRETKCNIVSEKEKYQHLLKRSVGYFTVVPLRHKTQYDLWMAEVKEGWRKSREESIKIDQRGWCAQWTIKLDVRDRVSASQSSTASKFTAGLTPKISNKTLGIHCCTSRSLPEAPDLSWWWRITAKGHSQKRRGEIQITHLTLSVCEKYIEHPATTRNKCWTGHTVYSSLIPNYIVVVFLDVSF